MSKEILEALGKLDPTDDSHWTGDGSPRLDVMKDLAGKAVTREELSAVAKDFTRKNPVLNTPPSDPPANHSGAQDNDAEAGDEDEDGKAKVEAELVAATENLSEARKRHSDALAAMDVIISKEAAASSGISTADDIKAFQKSQQKQRESQSVNAKELAALISSHKNSGRG